MSAIIGQRTLVWYILGPFRLVGWLWGFIYTGLSIGYLQAVDYLCVVEDLEEEIEGEDDA